MKEQIIKDSAKYNTAQYGSQILGIITGVAMRRFLGPYYIGIWNLLQVILGYFSYVSLGVDNAAVYKIPLLKGKGDKENTQRITNCVFSFLFIGSFVSSIALLAATFILRHRFPQEVIIGLGAASLCLILQRLYTYYVVVLRANSNFSVVSKSVIFDAVANLILIFLLVKNFKIYGLYVTVMLMPFLNTLFIHFLARYRIKLVFDLKTTLSLIKFGFPLFILGILGMILRSIDRIMIAKMLGVTFVGYYSIALMCKNYIVGLPNTFGIVIIPRILETYGKEEKIEHIKKFVTVTTETVSYIFPTILAFVFFISPLAVNMMLPNFTSGIFAMQVILLDVFFQSCRDQIEPFLIAIGKQTRIIPISILLILLNISLCYVLIKNGWGINGVAIGTMVTSLCGFVITLGYAMKHFASVKEIVRFILKILFPLAYVICIVMGCSYFVRILNPYIRLFVNLTVVSVASLPLLFYIDRKTHVLRLIFGYLKNTIISVKRRMINNGK